MRARAVCKRVHFTSIEKAADYLCMIELAAVKYDAKEDGGTYNKLSAALEPSRRTG